MGFGALTQVNVSYDFGYQVSRQSSTERDGPEADIRPL